MGHFSSIKIGELVVGNAVEELNLDRVFLVSLTTVKKGFSGFHFNFKTWDDQYPCWLLRLWISVYTQKYSYLETWRRRGHPWKFYAFLFRIKLFKFPYSAILFLTDEDSQKGMHTCSFSMKKFIYMYTQSPLLVDEILSLANLVSLVNSVLFPSFQ